MNKIKSIIELIKSFFKTKPQQTGFYSYNTDKNINTKIQLDPIIKKAEDQKLPKVLTEKEVTTTVLHQPTVKVNKKVELVQPNVSVKKKGRKPSIKKK